MRVRGTLEARTGEAVRFVGILLRGIHQAKQPSENLEEGGYCAMALSGPYQINRCDGLRGGPVIEKPARGVISPEEVSREK